MPLRAYQWAGQAVSEKPSLSVKPSSQICPQHEKEKV